MRKAFLTLLCMAAMLAAGTGLKAQEVSITLIPGWTWISNPSTDTLDFATALGTFTPMTGDAIKSQWGNAYYRNGRWAGSISQFYPGYGYKYYSNRTMPVTVTFNAQQPTPQVVVTTSEPTDITATSAISGGSVTSNDGSYFFILEKGICWATHPNPIVINDFYTENGEGLDSFSVEMSNLELNTVYYVRAYFVTANGTFYGEEKSFTTRDGIPTVITDSITNITRFKATCYGTVTDNGGLDVTTRGVCWSTNHNPTLSDNYTIDSLGLGSFSFDITRLYINTTYYVRTYVTNNYTTVYGNELCFNTDGSVGSGNAPVGAINGLFSVSDSQQVYFSQGNLQYQASTNTWQFADNQWDYIGEDNGNISPTYEGWIDLFSWGTGNDPTFIGLNQTFIDWGNNPILNGGNQEGEWRTLSGCSYNGSILWEEEWPYLLNSRTTASGIRYAKAQVKGVNGIIIVPDNWDSSVYSLNNPNSVNALFDSNVVSENEWENFFEETGCVFLPSGGYRYSGVGSVISVGEWGVYWSSSRRSYYYYGSHYDSDAFRLSFSNLEVRPDSYSTRSDGCSVRLVKNYNP